MLSGGSEPGSSLNPIAVAAMVEEGIDISRQVPSILETEQELEDPAGKDIDTVRRIRDDIRGRVDVLIASLAI